MNKQNKIKLINKLYEALFLKQNPDYNLTEFERKEATKAMTQKLNKYSSDYLDRLGSSLCGELLEHYTNEEITNLIFSISPRTA